MWAGNSGRQRREEKEARGGGELAAGGGACSSIRHLHPFLRTPGAGSIGVSAQQPGCRLPVMGGPDPAGSSGVRAVGGEPGKGGGVPKPHPPYPGRKGAPLLAHCAGGGCCPGPPPASSWCRKHWGSAPWPGWAGPSGRGRALGSPGLPAAPRGGSVRTLQGAGGGGVTAALQWGSYLHGLCQAEHPTALLDGGHHMPVVDQLIFKPPGVTCLG